MPRIGSLQGSLANGILTLDQMDKRFLPGGLWAAKAQKLKNAIALAQAGTRDATINFLGDSILYGMGNNSPTHPMTANIPTQVAALLASRRGLPTNSGLNLFGPQFHIGGDPDAIDSRWVLNASWRLGSLGWGGHSTIFSTAATNNTAVYTSGIVADSYRIQYYKGPGLGTVEFTATGGTPVTRSMDDVTRGVASVVATASSVSGSNTLTCKHTADGPVYLVSTCPFKAGSKQILVACTGRPSAMSGDFADTNPDALPPLPAFGSRPCMIEAAFDATIMMLGVNDGQASVNPATYVSPQTYYDNMMIIASDAMESGDAFFLTMPPSLDSTPAWTMQEKYINQMYKAARNLGAPMLDLWNAYGSTYQEPRMRDSLHLNQVGQQDAAVQITDWLELFI